MLITSEIAQLLLGDLNYEAILLQCTPRHLSRCCETSGRRFDFRYHLSYLFRFVNNVPFCVLFSGPVASPDHPRVHFQFLEFLFHPCLYGCLCFVDQGTWLFCIEIIKTLKVTLILNRLHHSYTCFLHHWSVIVLIDFFTPELLRSAVDEGLQQVSLRACFEVMWEDPGESVFYSQMARRQNFPKIGDNVSRIQDYVSR